MTLSLLSCAFSVLHIWQKMHLMKKKKRNLPGFFPPHRKPGNSFESRKHKYRDHFKIAISFSVIQPQSNCSSLGVLQKMKQENTGRGCQPNFSSKLLSDGQQEALVAGPYGHMFMQAGCYFMSIFLFGLSKGTATPGTLYHTDSAAQHI